MDSAIPEFCRISQSQRRRDWEAHPPRNEPRMDVKRRVVEIDPETAKLHAAIEHANRNQHVKP